MRQQVRRKHWLKKVKVYWKGWKTIWQLSLTWIFWEITLLTGCPVPWRVTWKTSNRTSVSNRISSWSMCIIIKKRLPTYENGMQTWATGRWPKNMLIRWNWIWKCFYLPKRSRPRLTLLRKVIVSCGSWCYPMVRPLSCGCIMICLYIRWRQRFPRLWNAWSWRYPRWLVLRDMASGIWTTWEIGIIMLLPRIRLFVML